MSAYDAILFDFDGVLADTEPVHYACWMEALEGCNVELDWERYARECVGLSERATADYFAALAKPPLTGEFIFGLYPRKKEAVRARVLAHPPVPAATIELMPRLKHLKLAVVSSSCHAEIDAALQASGLWDSMAVVICGDDVANHKPHPEPYLKAAQILGASKPLVLEDSDVGARSGEAAGFDVLRIASAASMPAQLLRKIGDYGYRP